MRAKIVSTATNWVTISYDDDMTGTRINFEAYAPLNGGYVRDEHGSQICDGLASRGNTLRWSGEYPLVDLIRREYKAMRRAEKRELERDYL